MTGKLCFQLKATSDLLMLVLVFQNVCDRLSLFNSTNVYCTLNICQPLWCSVLGTMVSKNRFPVGIYCGVGGTDSNKIIIIINVKL